MSEAKFYIVIIIQVIESILWVSKDLRNLFIYCLLLVTYVYYIRVIYRKYVEIKFLNKSKYLKSFDEDFEFSQIERILLYMLYFVIYIAIYSLFCHFYWFICHILC